MTIYVSNVGCHFTCSDLYLLFAQIGNVASANIVTDDTTGKSLRYGFVEMPDENNGYEAISKLNGKTIEGRRMFAGISKPKSEGSSKVNMKKMQSPAYRLAKGA